MTEGPLDDVKIVEVANWLAAPGAAAMMADMGADVVKIEPPNGDFYRGYMQAGNDDLNYNFELENRGKRSVTLDLRVPAGAEVVKRLCADADIFLTNLVPERYERYGVGYDAIRAANPRIVYAALTGYGTVGPNANKPGFDASAFWAASGIMDVMGSDAAVPVHSRGGQGDHPTAMTALAAILAALHMRNRTGEAQFVDVSLQRAGVWTLASDLQRHLGGFPGRPRQNRLQQGMNTWNSYRTRDERWLMLVMNDPPRYWDRFAKAMGREDWVGDTRFNTTPELVQHGASIIPEIDAIFAEHDLDYWTARLDEYGCLWALAQSLEEVVTDPQLTGYDAFPQVPLPNGGSYQTIGTPFDILEADVRPRGPAPEVGAHTHEALNEAGFTPDEIAALAEGRVFG